MVLALVLIYLEKIGEGFMSGIGGLLVAPIKQQFEYLCCFNSHITELETKLRDLEATRQVVLDGADEIRRQARVVRPDIEEWLESVNEVITEVKGIIQVMERVEEGCFNGWCSGSNLKLRYSLSMQAVTKTKVLIDLRDVGVQYTQTLPSCSSPLPGLETITNRDFMGFESRRLIMEEIIKALKHDEINLIGVCGMGGVGKTTLVEEVAKIAKEDNHFHEVAMAVVSQKPNLTDVQACIAELLGLTNLSAMKSSIARADRLRRRLLQDNKKVLVILDDIWVEFDLQAMGIPLEGANKNFKVLYTSRTQDLWDDLRTKKEIPLDVLSKDEAWQLFREKAGDSADAPDLQPIAKQIVDECGCLPLALLLIGRRLSKKSGRNHIKDIWEEMLDRLTRTSSTPANEQLSSRLALSYEYLEDEQAKRLFLLCCLFREDEEIRIEDLARYGLGLSLFDGINEMEKVRRRVLALVDDLKSSYLLLDGKNKEECVKVHDVVRDMGLYVASKFALVIHGEESEWPKKDTYEDYTSISLVSRKITKLPKRLTCPNLEFLLLDCTELKELSCQFFEGMGKLKVLVLKNFKGILALPSSLRNLHTLSLPFFNGKLNNVSEFGGPFNLKTLSFRDSQMEELPEEVRKLVNLKLLDLTDTEVERIPPGVISRLVHLEELYLNEFKYWEGEGKEEEGINANLRELESLPNLNALEIYIRSDVIPKFSIRSKLKLYNVVIELEEMDDISDEEFEDEMDDISDEVIEDEMDDISDEVIEDEMDDISDEVIEDEMDDISDEEIDQQTMEDISLDDETIGEEEYCFNKKCKRVLEVRSSIPIPSNRGGIELLLRNSDFLVLEGNGCNDLVQALQLRDGVDGLKQKFLRIERCDAPECLANTMNPVHLPIAHASPIFPILNELHLLRLVNLREICGGPVPARSFGELTFIRIQKCRRLRNLFQLPIGECLPQLNRLTIFSCGKMEEVFWKEQQEEVHAATNRIEFPKLEVLQLGKLPSLMGFCRGIDQIDFPQLKKLYLKEIPHVNFLFHNNSNLSSNSKGNDNVGFLSFFPEKVSLPNLEHLNIHELENLERLGHGPLPVGSLSKLIYFSVSFCDKLLCVFPSQLLSMLRDLWLVSVIGCDSLEVVFELEELDSNEPNPEILSPLIIFLADLPELKYISKRYPVGFKYIQTLEIENCNSLSYVFAPTMTKSIPQLRKLAISSCEMLSRIVAEENGLGESSVDEVEFPQLEHLELLDLPNLVTFFPNVNTTTMAKSTDHLHNPMQSQPLFNEKVAFPGVKYLGLSGLQNVSDLWGSELPTSSFSKLETLNVRGFANLRSTFYPSMVRGLANLSELVITDCSKMEGVVYWEEEIEDGQGRKVEKTMFPLLRKLQLSNLPNLVSFFPNVNVNTTTLAKSTDHYHDPLQPQPLLNEKVAFPSLEYLELSGLESVSDLWCSELPTNSFSKLKTLNVRGFPNLRSTFHISMIGGLANLSELVIADCSKMEGVVYWEEEIEDGQGRKVEKTMFPLLRKLQLSNLPNLVSFFPNVNTTLAKSIDHYHNPMQPQPLFNEKVAFPCLKYLGLSGLRNVSELPTSSISNLKNLPVTDSTGLRNFPCILWIDDLNNITQVLQEVARLLYTNDGDGVLALGSNGTMTGWKWDRSQHNPSGKATASALPHQWQPASGLAMTNDVIGVNLEEAVPCVALSKDDFHYIISACGGAISLFSKWTLKVSKRFMPPPPASTFLAFYPDQENDVIAIGMEDSTIRIYNHWKDKVIKSEMKGHKKYITGLAFSTNLNILVSSGADAQLCTWRVNTWEHLKSVSIQLPAVKACNSDTRVQFHSDQIRLLVSHETQLAIYDAFQMDRICQWVPQDVLPAPISFAVYSCDSQLVYTSFCDGNIGVFDADRLTLRCRIAPSIYFSPAMLSGGQGEYPRVVVAHPSEPNQFAIGMTNGSVIVMEPQESEGKWGLSPTVDHNGMLNDRTASSSNTSNHTPDQFHSVEEGDSATSSGHILPQASGSESGLTLPALEEIDLDANLQVFRIGTYPQQPKPECYRRQPQRPKPKHNRRHPPQPLLQEGEINSVVRLDESEGGVVP